MIVPTSPKRDRNFIAKPSNIYGPLSPKYLTSVKARLSQTFLEPFIGRAFTSHPKGNSTNAGRLQRKHISEEVQLFDYTTT
ncbi:hypothetical protein RvVAR031_29710 [Agrobacterium vitis]|nr:hypothetical protein RvVAR031_29710 [Agrobacterium vitis]